MNFFEKIQNLPEEKKKRIVWIVLIIVAIILGIWYSFGFGEKIKNIRGETIVNSLKITEMKEQLKNLPSLPNFDTVFEKLKELKTLATSTPLTSSGLEEKQLKNEQ